MQIPRGEDVEVAISGGGPVALCLALILARNGIAVRVFEKETELGEDLRASTFHPPTLDMLDTLGLGPGIMEHGVICPHWQIRLHPSGERAVFDLSVLEKDTAHPYRLQYEQFRLSHLLLDALQREPNADIHFGAEVSGISQDDDGVTVNIGETAHRARFAVGADGARSIVRQSLGMRFEGETYPETTLLTTTTFPFEDHLEGLSNVSYCWKAGGNFALLRVPGRWRVSIYPSDDLPLEDQLTPEAIEVSLQEIVPSATTYEVLERRPYRVHQRIVPRYVEGRVALAGDAAHLNAPTGGMGLNGGLHDAFELAAALIDRLRHGAGPERLALYERRRRPVAQEQILKQSDANRQRMRERSPEKRREILAGLQEITKDPEKLRVHLLKSSMIEGLRQAAAVS